MPDDARIKALEASIARDERIAALEASIARDEGATRFESPGLDPAAVDAAMGQAVEQRRAQQAWEERTRPARRIMEWKSRAESEPSGYRRPGFNPSAMPDPPPETITEGVGNVIGHGLTTAIEAPVEQFKSAAYKAGYGETRPDDISGEQDTQGAFADAARGLMSLLPPVAALTASRAAQVKAMQEAQAEGVTPNAFARAVDAGNTGFEGAMHHAINVGERQLPYLVADAVQRTGLTDMTSEEVAKARSPIGGLLMEVLPFGLLGTKRAITERFGGEGKVSAPRAGTPEFEMQRARSQPAPKIGELETRRMERMAARERFRTESENPQAWLPKEKRGDPPPLRTEPPIAPVPKPKSVVPILPPQTPVTTSNPSKALVDKGVITAREAGIGRGPREQAVADGLITAREAGMERPQAPATEAAPKPIEQPKPVPEATAPKAADVPDPRIQGALDTMNKEKGGDGTVTLRSTPIDEMFMSVAKPVAKLGERVYDAVDAQLAKRVTEPVFNKVGAALEKSSKGRKLKAAADWAFRDPARVISEEFAAEVAKGRGAKDLARLDAGQTGKSLGESLRGVPEATRREVYRYMNSERADLPSGLTDAQRLVIDSSVKEIQSITRDLVSEGILSPEAADQFARYLPRLYEDSLMSRSAFAARREFRAGETFTRTNKHLARMKQGDISHEQFRELAKANGGFAVTRKGKVIQAKFETAKQRRDFLGKLDTERRAQILTDLDIPFRRTRSGAIRPDFGKTTAAKRDAYQRRVGGDPVLSRRGVARENPLPDEVREMLGEVTDPAEAAAYAVQAGKARLAVHRFFKAVKKGGDANGRWVFPDEASAPDGAVLLGEKWAGPLKGKYVREDVAQFLQDVHGVPKGGSDFARAWIAQWKANKTVLSPRTAFRQAMSAPQQLHMAGVNITNPNNWATLREAFRALNPEHPMHRVMIENQIIRGSLPSHEIRILERHLEGKGSAWSKFGQALANPIMLTKKGRMAQEAAAGFYNIPDATVRATVFLDRLSKGMSVRDAVIEVNRYTNNYATVGRGVRWASDNPFVSPFIRFKAETARNFVNAAHYHPLRALTALFHTKAMRALIGATLLSEMTDDDWEALDNERGGLELPFPFPSKYNEKGNLHSFDMQYVDIFGDWTPKPDVPGDAGVIKQGAEIAGFTGSPGVEVASAALQLMSGEDIEDARNRVFAREGMTDSRRALGFGEFYGKSVLPTWTPFIGHQAKVVEAAAKGEQVNPYTPKQDLTRALISALFGFNTREFDPTREMDKLSYQERKRKSALKAQANEGYDSKDAMKRTATEARDRRRVLVKARKASRERAKMK